jgi:hypothetical protein
MIYPRHRFSSIVFSDHLYVFGGQNINGTLALVEMFDGDSWASAPSLRVARMSFAVGVLGRAVYIIGGTRPASSTTSTEIFDGVSYIDGPPLLAPRASLGGGIMAL